MNNVYLNCDVLEGLKLLEDNSVDLVVADPPYFEVWGEFDFVFESRDSYLEWCRSWLLEIKRVLKPTGTLMLWGWLGKKNIMLARLAILIEDNELFLRQNWITQRNTRGTGQGSNYMSTREDLLFLTSSSNYTFNVPYLDEKSNRKDLGANGKVRKNEFKRASNVWFDITEASQSSIERCFHPTVKAQKLCDRIILTHSNENDVVLIPFAGSGSEIISCIKNNRNFIAFELSEFYFDNSKLRISSFVDFNFE